jgi:hypothetical protein
MSIYAPRIETIQIKPSKIALVLGKGGEQIRSITEQTGIEKEARKIKLPICHLKMFLLWNLLNKGSTHLCQVSYFFLSPLTLQRL